MDNTFIYEKRIELGLTQEQVAKACGVSKMTVSKWESGLIENIRQDKIASLAKILHVSPLEIIGLSSSADLAIDREERALIIAYRKQPAAVQEAILRMLGIEVGEKGSGVSAS